MNHLTSSVGPCALALLLATPAVAEDIVVRSFPFQPGDLLEIETEGGDIAYEVGGSGELTINVVAHQGEVSDYLDLDFMPGPNGLRIDGEKVGGGAFWSRLSSDLSLGVVIFQIDGQNGGQIVRRLYEEHGVGCAATGGIRLSPQVYCTMEDVDRVVGAVRSMV